MNQLLQSSTLQEVISLSSFKVHDGRFVYTRVSSILPGLKHLMIIDDSEEITIVTEESNLSQIGPHEANKERWRLINIRCGNPFYCVGFIAGITTALANEGVDVVLTSSFTKDLVMVMEKDLDHAIDILKREGFSRE